MSPPVGPTGMPQACDGTAHKLWSVGASLGGFQTQIVFPNQRVRTRQLSTSLSIARSATPRFLWSVTASRLSGVDVERRPLLDGEALALGASVLAVYERRSRPFVAFTGSAGAAHARAIADDGRVRDW